MRVVSSIGILLIKLGGGDMVAVYVALIIEGLRTLDMVPIRIRPSVAEALDALGIDGEGNPIMSGGVS